MITKSERDELRRMHDAGEIGLLTVWIASDLPRLLDTLDDAESEIGRLNGRYDSVRRERDTLEAFIKGRG